VNKFTGIFGLVDYRFVSCFTEISLFSICGCKSSHMQKVSENTSHHIFINLANNRVVIAGSSQGWKHIVINWTHKFGFFTPHINQIFRDSKIFLILKFIEKIKRNRVFPQIDNTRVYRNFSRNCANFCKINENRAQKLHLSLKWMRVLIKFAEFSFNQNAHRIH
jgi:hypothetical protein